MPLNHVVLASGTLVAVSVAVATVIAVYESPEFRRYTEDVRRRLAMVFDSLHDGVAEESPPFRPPRFNRPEDADGFFLSSRRGNEPGVDADDETRRKQREELLYWNAVRLDKERQRQSRGSLGGGEVEKRDGGLVQDPPPAPSARHRGSSFDDFLRPDKYGEKGSYVFNSSGADVGVSDGLRHRGARTAAPAAPAAAAAAAPAVIAAPFSSGNPFADGHYANDARQLPPANLDIMSDIYSATTPDREEQRPVLPARSGAFTRTRTPTPTPATLVDLSPCPVPPQAPEPREMPAAGLSRPVPETDASLAAAAAAAATLDERQEVFASIQAWAHDSSRDFYSPLPVTPVAPVSEPELISEGGFSEDFSEAGELTPLDGLSLAGSGEDVGNHLEGHEHGWAQPQSERPFDVMSESEGMATPASWSEVGSVISESEPFPLH